MRSPFYRSLITKPGSCCRPGGLWFPYAGGKRFNRLCKRSAVNILFDGGCGREKLHSLPFKRRSYDRNGGLVAPAAHLHDHVERFPAAPRYRVEIAVDVPGHFPAPDRACDNKRVDAGEIGLRRFYGRFHTQKRFHRFPPDAAFAVRLDFHQFSIQQFCKGSGYLLRMPFPRVVDNPDHHGNSHLPILPGDENGFVTSMRRKGNGVLCNQEQALFKKSRRCTITQSEFLVILTPGAKRGRGNAGTFTPGTPAPYRRVPGTAG